MGDMYTLSVFDSRMLSDSVVDLQLIRISAVSSLNQVQLVIVDMYDNKGMSLCLGLNGHWMMKVWVG